MKAVLFDLDGTLLPMDQEVFTKTYKMWHKIPTRLVESCAIFIWKNEF